MEARDEWFTEEIDDKKIQILLQTKDVSKRESASMSNESTFDGIKKKLNTYVIEEWGIQVPNSSEEMVSPEWLSSKRIESISSEADVNILLEDIAETVAEMPKAYADRAAIGVKLESISSQIGSIRLKLENEPG